VQGVGFRPFLFNLAQTQGLTGWVRNNFGGVELEIQGKTQYLKSFLNDISLKAPSAAAIETITFSPISTISESDFRIRDSEFGEVAGSPLPDQGICPDCAREFFNPEERRYQYPFTSCTICGPRFTIIQDLPFDRPRTTMAEFRLCPDCLSEYTKAADRRFHAQTIACPNCGPQLWFADAKGRRLAVDPALETGKLLGAGAIIGVKGIGGYHLACSATDEDAVRRLRCLKGRDNRAFAVMFRNLTTLQEHCELSPVEADILSSPARPIMLLLQKQPKQLAPSVNPGLRELGAFLPYTGIQFLLFDPEISALVMTSGNRSGEPLSIDDWEAFRDLGPMVDGFLGHNRSIRWRCDDSVLRRQQDTTLGIRRSRGYAPAPIKVDRELIPLLACGAQQKNVFALTKGKHVYLSPHQGDLDKLPTFTAYQETIERFMRLLQCKPEWAIHDLHPDYNSTLYAKGSALKTIGIQHHLAHIASVIAACQVKGPCIGVVFDGSGYGTDGKIWGGEFFSGEGANWQREAALSDYPLPGGAAAIREPWRMAAAYLQSSDRQSLQEWLTEQNLTEPWKTLEVAAGLGINTPYTSSMGRFFDGIAALIGGPCYTSYQGEAAIWLENQAETKVTSSYPFHIEQTATGLRLDPGLIAVQVYQDLKRHEQGIISMKFHRTMAAFIVETATLLRKETGYQQIVLGGGVFQNRLLMDLSVSLLKDKGFQVWIPDLIPLNDGGIALGQAWLGSLMIERGITDVFSDTR
ncbi:MAG TPA: carbamoyltransferase HypF, partial [Firmicutes bacterium]|nr:carbamoyltransferase HypF [Bacillota bacterium]